MGHALLAEHLRRWSAPSRPSLRRVRYLHPRSLVGAGLALTPETEGLAAQAETRARAVNASPDLVRIGRFLLRNEAIASSRIEGIAPSAHKIALAELGQQEEIKGLSEQARSVAHNMTLVRRAVEELSDSHPMTREHLVALHRSLLPDSPEHHGIRVVQNWLGGSSYHPLDADFVPPPADLLPSLIDDLLEYLNGATHAPLIQAALVHAQFETIHPFTDGDGRVGRALIHATLARRGLLTGLVLPTSLVLATLGDGYVEALSLFREPANRKPNGSAAQSIPGTGRDAWIAFFLKTVMIACDQAEQISAELADLREEWNEDLQHWASHRNASRSQRKDSAALRILEDLPGTPVLTITTASRIHGISRTAASRGLETLRAAGILTTESVGGSRRAYTARSVLDVITWAERRLASTHFDTRVSLPTRPVPEPVPAPGLPEKSRLCSTQFQKSLFQGQKQR